MSKVMIPLTDKVIQNTFDFEGIKSAMLYTGIGHYYFCSVPIENFRYSYSFQPYSLEKNYLERIMGEIKFSREFIESIEKSKERRRSSLVKSDITQDFLKLKDSDFFLLEFSNHCSGDNKNHYHFLVNHSFIELNYE